MHFRRLPLRIGVPFIAFIVLLVLLGLGSPASAVTLNDRLIVLSRWTQASSSSYGDWNAARLDQSAWSRYAFDWATNYCTASPDQPLGFDFRLPCWRHDFGYRNYFAVGAYAANRNRIDSAFYFDLKQKCTTYSVWVRPACYSLAWAYYEVAHNFGYLAVDQASLAHAARLKAEGLKAEADARARKAASD